MNMLSDTTGVRSAKGNLLKLYEIVNPFSLMETCGGKEKKTHSLKGTEETYIDCLHGTSTYTVKPYLDLNQAHKLLHGHTQMKIRKSGTLASSLMQLSNPGLDIRHLEIINICGCDSYRGCAFRRAPSSFRNSPWTSYR